MSSVLLTRRVLAACAIAATAFAVAAIGAPARPADSAHSRAEVLDRPLPVLPDGALEVQGAHGQAARPVRAVQGGVISRQALCNPVSKNDEGIQDKTGHLVCYGIRSRPVFKPRDVQVRHQFTDRMRLRVVRPVRLCLPSAKSETDPEPGEIPKLDHYQCYAVKPLTASRSATSGWRTSSSWSRGTSGRRSCSATR